MAEFKVPCAMSLTSEAKQRARCAYLGRVKKKKHHFNIFKKNKGMLFNLDIVLLFVHQLLNYTTLCRIDMLFVVAGLELVSVRSVLTS